MKKHIIGLALFSFIVGAAAIIYAVFNVGSIEEVFVITNTEKYPATKSCWKMKQELKNSSINGLTVRQAVFDLKTKQLNWELAVPRSDLQIKLHFFVKDANGARYLNSAYAPQQGFENGIIKVTSSYEWLDRLGSYENLYVVPEIISQTNYDSTSSRPSADIPDYVKREPEFNAEKATSVLLYSGERGLLDGKVF